MIVSFAPVAHVQDKLTYEKALQLALKKKDPAYCQKLIQGRFYGDYFENLESAKLYCVSDYMAEIGDIKGCLKLDSIHPTNGISQKHACIEKFAAKHQKLELCLEIDYPKGDGRANDVILYHDRCRAQAIWKPEQCEVGFKTRHWQEAVSEDCKSRISKNR